MRSACPFCGNTKHYIGGTDEANQTFFVHCMNCGARGPQKPSLYDADQAWEARTESTVPSPNEIKKELGLYNNG